MDVMGVWLPTRPEKAEPVCEDCGRLSVQGVAPAAICIGFIAWIATLLFTTAAESKACTAPSTIRSITGIVQIQRPGEDARQLKLDDTICGEDLDLIQWYTDGSITAIYTNNGNELNLAPANLTSVKLLLPFCVIFSAGIITVLILVRKGIYSTAGILVKACFFASGLLLAYELSIFLMAFKHPGMVRTFADLIGFQHADTSMAEHPNTIKPRTMTSNGKDIVGLAALLVGFVSIIVYFVWWYVGRMFLMHETHKERI